MNSAQWRNMRVCVCRQSIFRMFGNTNNAVWCIIFVEIDAAAFEIEWENCLNGNCFVFHHNYMDSLQHMVRHSHIQHTHRCIDIHSSWQDACAHLMASIVYLTNFAIDVRNRVCGENVLNVLLCSYVICPFNFMPGFANHCTTQHTHTISYCLFSFCVNAILISNL